MSFCERRSAVCMIFCVEFDGVSGCVVFSRECDDFRGGRASDRDFAFRCNGEIGVHNIL